MFPRFHGWYCSRDVVIDPERKPVLYDRDPKSDLGVEHRGEAHLQKVRKIPH
jgi:hypothetical protein